MGAGTDYVERVGEAVKAGIQGLVSPSGRLAMSDPLFLAEAKRIAAELEEHRISIPESMRQWAEAVARAVSRLRETDAEQPVGK